MWSSVHNPALLNNTNFSDNTSPRRHQISCFSTTPTTTSCFVPDSVLDIDSEINSQSTSSSPQSTVASFPLSTFDTVPPSTVPRTAQNSLFNITPISQPQALQPANAMYDDSWLGDNAPLNTKANCRSIHNRDSSLSSLGSLGPASPFQFSSSNPQIAVNDAADNYQSFQLQDDSQYHLVAKAPASTSHDTYYANFPYSDCAVQAYATMLAPHKHRADRNGLLPPPEFSTGGSSNSRPASVASSVASDSPATPTAPEAEEERRRKNVITTVPKLDRTMTDIYDDELYNPNFSITTTSPSQPSQTAAMSPNHELFAQRVQAANNQHLSATQSPMKTISRGRSPFKPSSPLAPAPANDFTQGATNQIRFNTAQQMRERTKAEETAQALRHTVAQSNGTGTPQTISPKDAILEFGDADNSSNFPLFPQQQTSSFDTNQIVKANSQPGSFGGLPLDTTTFENYLTPQIPSNMQLPQQYPFVGKHRAQSSLSSSVPPALPSASNGSFSMSSRVGSSPSLSPDTSASGSPQRPTHVGAEGGTYTCTYHGCTLRFETPALLQRHKREGHRQAHGLNGLRRPEVPGNGYFNTQAGPHKCERINPSTGKPCNTVFSRPYDLTRHEDTIHNARKQKVQCDVCTEEKTFSRADALTRHYRVCHPDLEVPGKQRKRGIPSN